MGDLDEYGWKVVRGVRASQDTYDAIDWITTLGKKGHPVKNPKWHSIEERDNNRVMKYDHLSKIHEQWKTDKFCANFLVELEHVVLKKALKVDDKRPNNKRECKPHLG